MALPFCFEPVEGVDLTGGVAEIGEDHGELAAMLMLVKGLMHQRLPAGSLHHPPAPGAHLDPFQELLIGQGVDICQCFGIERVPLVAQDR